MWETFSCCVPQGVILETVPWMWPWQLYNWFLLAVCYLLQFKASYFCPLHVEVISLLIWPQLFKVGCIIHWINHYPMDKCLGNQLCYPVYSDLSSGYRYPPCEKKQLGPGVKSPFLVTTIFCTYYPGFDTLFMLIFAQLWFIVSF